MTDEEIWNKTPGSDNRLNNMTNMKNTGTYLEALDKSKHGIWICTADGASLLKDHVYLCNAAGDAVIDLTAVQPHTHLDNDTGGNISEIFAESSTFMIFNLTKVTDLYEASWASPVYWIKTITGTGSVENFTDGSTGERAIRLRPNGTSGSEAQIQYPHLKMGFGSPSIYKTKLKIETASSLALHAGPNADDITAADSNTRKYQAEVCTVTNNNWWLRTADNTANSSSDTGIAISTSAVAIAIVHQPDAAVPETDMYVDSGAVLQKTSNIPNAGATAANNIVKYSIKNSTGADRPLLVYGSQICYYVSDSWN